MKTFLEIAEAREKRESKQLEVDIETPFVEYAESRGCWPCKLVFLRGRGWPDRSVFCPGGGVMLVEFKRPDKAPKPSTVQRPIMRRLEKLGFKYVVANANGMAEKELDNFLNR
jgi:hypothetical protein